MIILFIFHFCGVGEVSQGWRRGLVAVRFSCWKHLTDAVVCAAAGRLSRRELAASWLLRRDVLLLFSVGDFVTVIPGQLSDSDAK